MKTCYQCEKPCDYLFDDSRCKDCTRLTPAEVQGVEVQGVEWSGYFVDEVAPMRDEHIKNCLLGEFKPNPVFYITEEEAKWLRKEPGFVRAHSDSTHRTGVIGSLDGLDYIVGIEPE